MAEAVPTAHRIFRAGHREHQPQVGQPTREVAQLVEVRGFLGTAVAVDQRDPVVEAARGDLAKDAAKRRDPDAAGNEDRRDRRILVEAEGADRPHHLVAAAQRRLGEDRLERAVAGAPRELQMIVAGRGRECQRPARALLVAIGRIRDSQRHVLPREERELGRLGESIAQRPLRDRIAGKKLHGHLRHERRSLGLGYRALAAPAACASSRSTYSVAKRCASPGQRAER